MGKKFEIISMKLFAGVNRKTDWLGCLFVGLSAVGGENCSTLYLLVIKRENNVKELCTEKKGGKKFKINCEKLYTAFPALLSYCWKYCCCLLLCPALCCKWSTHSATRTMLIYVIRFIYYSSFLSFPFHSFPFQSLPILAIAIHSVGVDEWKD